MENYLPKINKSLLIEKVNIDSSPEELFALFSDSPEMSFLYSSLETSTERYSFIGIDPFLVLSGKKDNLKLKIGEHELPVKKDPFECLRTLTDAYKVENPTSFPFVAGSVGYFSYDLKDTIERLRPKSKDDLNLADIYFAFYRTLIIYDKLNAGELHISIVDIDSPEHKKASVLMQEVKNLLKSGPQKPLTCPKKDTHYKPVFKSNLSKKHYMKSIKKVIDYIYAGDIYQACLSHRFKAEWPFSGHELYLKLNKINPSPFSAYLNFENAKVISSSPELFIRLRDNVVETRPMKGTRPRGKNNEEDDFLKDQLKNSQKDDAELSMIVDLERNDLGKIAVPGSVKISDHRKIETYSTVFQTVSTVKCDVASCTNPIDIIKAAFPGGSITGCPKIRAMEIIDELEPTKRGIYTGAIGYISFHDTMDLNVAIRTMIMKGKNVYFQVGSGIVADSDPEEEYLETLDKARALMESLT